MPRKKLSEFRAKRIIHEALGLAYTGYPIDTSAPLPKQLKRAAGAERFVVKVDQGVKGRFKKGLVLLDIPEERLIMAAKQLASKGYRWLIIEPMLSHEASDERYLSLSQDRQGLHLTFSSHGGIDIEAHADALQTQCLTEATDWTALSQQTRLSEPQLRSLVDVFEQNYMVFLEINPYVVTPSGIRLLDLAIEVDDAGAYFVEAWQETDFRSTQSRALTPQEQTVVELAQKSPASFKLDVINSNGSIFLLLSGGGASILVADEVYNHGFGKQLANYGEYSGNPNTEETYIYTKAVLELLLASKARRKVLFIGGAVANFTDIANTFTGVIQAIDAMASQLRKQHVKVFVRRGGPRQEIGLSKIEAALKRHELLGAVHGPDVHLPTAVTEFLKEVA